MKAHSRSTDILYSFSNLSARWEWCSMPRPSHFSPPTPSKKEGCGLQCHALATSPLKERGGWPSMPHPGHFTPGRETWYPFYRSLDEPHSGCRQSQSPDYAACSRSLYQPHYLDPPSKTTSVSYFACNCSYRLSPVR